MLHAEVDLASALRRMKYGTFKYVHLFGGIYRFCSSMFYHKDLLEKEDRVISAGFVHFDFEGDTRSVKVPLDQPSMGLNIWPEEEDQAAIRKLFLEALGGENQCASAEAQSR